MSPPVPLAAGANQPLDGQRITIELHAASLGGALVLCEEDGPPRPLPPTDAAASVTVGEGSARIEVALASVPPAVTRLRVLMWSPQRTRVLQPAGAEVAVDGTPCFVVTVGEPGGFLRSAEVLELYLRHGAWKVRAIGSGWEDGVPAMARAVGLPESAFSAPGGVGPGAGAGPHTGAGPGASRTAAAHHGPSPAVGPPVLRALADAIVGPGWRDGDGESLFFQVGDVVVHLILEQRGQAARLTAVVPLGSGPRTDETAEAALRATGAAPLSRVALIEGGGAIVTAVATLMIHQLDSAVVKALLADAWVTAGDFAARVRAIGWDVTDRIAGDVPRELRLGIGEELQNVGEWREVRERLILNDCIPLADAPEAVLAVQQDGQLVIGPTLLAGTSRAWAILVERVLRSDVVPRPGLWRTLAERQEPVGPVRIGVVDEVGHNGPPAITVGYAALQLPRTQVLEDLQRGMEAVDAAANDLHGPVGRLTPGATWERNNLPWVPTRRWNGPGTELRESPLVRELATLPAGAPPPAGYADRVRHGAADAGRASVAWIAHLALLRAEAVPSDGAWLDTARRLVNLAPVSSAGANEPSATASLHVRLDRLTHPRPLPSAGDVPLPPPPGGDGAPAPPRPGRRWRIFG